MTGAQFSSLFRLPSSSIWSTVFATLKAGQGVCKLAREGKRVCQVGDFSFLLHSSP